MELVQVSSTDKWKVTAPGPRCLAASAVGSCVMLGLSALGLHTFNQSCSSQLLPSAMGNVGSGVMVMLLFFSAVLGSCLLGLCLEPALYQGTASFYRNILAETVSQGNYSEYFDSCCFFEQKDF